MLRYENNKLAFTTDYRQPTVVIYERRMEFDSYAPISTL